MAASPARSTSNARSRNEDCPPLCPWLASVFGLAALLISAGKRPARPVQRATRRRNAAAGKATGIVAVKMPTAIPYPMTIVAAIEEMIARLTAISETIATSGGAMLGTVARTSTAAVAIADKPRQPGAFWKRLCCVGSPGRDFACQDLATDSDKSENPGDRQLQISTAFPKSQ